MSRSRARLVIAILVVCGLTACCGGPATPTVGLSIQAPVDGATVTVPSLVVLGTIEPRDAVVTVDGTRAAVTNGAFKRPMSLRARLTRISVVASAPGYLSSNTELSITYEPGPAAAVPGAHRTPGPGPHSTGAGLGTGAGHGGDSSTQAETAFVSGCSSGGASEVGCLCLWRALDQRGFTSVAQWTALLEQWRRSFMSKGVIAFPPALRTAVESCAADFRTGLQ